MERENANKTAERLYHDYAQEMPLFDSVVN